MLELLVVMGIMVILMSIGAAGYFGMRRGAEIRGATTMVQSTLMLARQQAVTKRRTVEVTFHQRGATNALQVIEIIPGVTNIMVHEEITLPPGVMFDGAKPDPIAFVPAGKAGGAGTAEIHLVERADGIPQRATIKVWNLTGITRVTFP